MLPRIRDFVHNEFPIVADPEQITRKPFDIFGIYLIDKQGIVQTYIPGVKEARARLDVVLTELAKLEGVDPPPFKLVDGNYLPDVATETPQTLSASEVINVRWMWNNNLIWAKDRFKLAFITTIADGYHVYGNDETKMTPFKIDFELPEGFTITNDYDYPESKRIMDPILEVPLSVYEGDIPMPVILIRAGDDLQPGDYTATARIHYQACNDSICLPPTVKVIAMPLKVVTRDTRRGKVAGSGLW